MRHLNLVTNAVVDFIIVAFVIFLLVRAVSRIRRLQAEPAPAAPATKDCTYCFSSIQVKATRCPHCTSELKAA